MSQPGRPRRRGKLPTNSFQRMPKSLHQQQGPGTNMTKDEPTIQLHDEADLISFRSDALARFVTNQEYLENVTSKFINTSKIIPPSVFPSIAESPEHNKEQQHQKQSIKIRKDLEALKSRLIGLKEDLEKEKSSLSYLLDDDKYNFQKKSIDELARLQSGLGDKESFDKLQESLDRIMSEFQSQFHRTYTAIPSHKKYSIPAEKISKDIKIVLAPENYDPRLINSFISINGNGNTQNDGENDNSHGNDELQDISGDDFNDTNGLFLDLEDHHNKEYDNDSNIPDNFAMTMVNSNGGDENSNDISDPTANSMQRSQGQGDGSDAINQLLETGEGTAGLAQNESDIINDDMGDLINFDVGEEDPMINEGTFDQDFLSQIDHSME
ncbi:uncharacterized protein PRCAT00003851001 [Priceomyces carsonii]|uniref:uncharacterized protein n=1 Tax=Priceomyces carsonii TaxID=28549 RepID=UPI002ED96061|nr:unnamed protein product [Priceomyces carsonii]